ncbi:hypothetical protein AX15_000205 [Amanita polypyramis BW_CC]|nr:hypothetical protein AX15_000205 [Amanita polypyramis BW_CC]
MVFIITSVGHFFENTFVFTWDVLLELTNLVLPRRKEGHVVLEGHPGFGGKWPEYIPPKDGDSRSACPGLNALANHGILPRDGRNISFKEMTEKTRLIFNVAPTLSYVTTKHAADMLNKSYGKGTCDLEEISLHNGIEHDGSLTRLDYGLQKDQSKPHLPFVHDLLDSASGKDKQGNILFTLKDIARYSAKRRAESRASNPEYSLSFSHKLFSCANNSILLSVLGGRKQDIEVFLAEERIPDGWESRNRKHFGLTLTKYNVIAIPLEIQTDEKTAAKELAEMTKNQVE